VFRIVVNLVETQPMNGQVINLLRSISNVQPIFAMLPNVESKPTNCPKLDEGEITIFRRRSQYLKASLPTEVTDEGMLIVRRDLQPVNAPDAIERRPTKMLRA
jgi:hypothetical protein